MPAQVLEFPRAEFAEALLDDQMRAFGPERMPKEIDCGDDRILTHDCAMERTGIPARHFGGATGLGNTAMGAVLIQYENGEELVRRWLSEYPNGVADLSADIADRALLLGIKIHQHSSDGVEGHSRIIVPDISSPLGCAYNALFGLVTAKSADSAVMDRVAQIANINGEPDMAGEADLARRAFGVLLPLIGGERASITRDALLKARESRGNRPPIAVVHGEHCPSDQASVVYDLAGYKANPDGKRYFHSIRLPELLLPQLLPEFSFDTKAIRAASLVTGVATQTALGVERSEVIPAGFSRNTIAA